MRIVILGLIAATTATQEKPKPEPPMVLYSAPLVAKPGTKAKYTLRGLRLDAVSEVKSEGATVKLLGKPKKAAVPGGAAAARHGDTECEIELDLPAEFKADVLELVAVTPSGEATYKLIVAKDSIAEKEPNDGFAEAQAITLPATLDATIGREKDVDTFQFTGKAGQKIHASAFALRLGSPTDLFLTLYDSGRNALAKSDDTRGEPDPDLIFTLPRDGVYYIVLQEANDLGGPQYGYRLVLK